MGVGSGRARRRVRAAAGLCALLLACAESDEPEARPSPSPAPAAPARSARLRPRPEPTPEPPARRAFFGDLHLHTALSLDAYAAGARLLPDDAYRYAKGDWIPDETGTPVRRRSALDFAAVTDHAEGLGLARALADPGDPLSHSPLARDLAGEGAAGHRAFRRIAAAVAAGRLAELLPPEEIARVSRAAWRELIEAAEHHDAPGRFTTFVAYEWTATRAGAALHRNVLFAGADVPERPFSALDSTRPEDLWTQLEAWRSEGDDVIAIPHDTSASPGRLYARVDSDGRPVDADYAARRRRNEPVSELVERRGTAETRPALSPGDEFADFEPGGTIAPASSVRSAYGNGLALEARGRSDPFRFAVIGSSGAHDAASTVDEHGFTGPRDGVAGAAARRLRAAAGLAGVWAETNTRAAIFAALRRGETFATSGPRIRVRLFAGVRFPARLHERPDAFARAAERGVPMGGTLVLRGHQRPTLLVRARRDPRSAPLERIQIVKGWLRDGEPTERIYDVACSEGLLPDPDTHRCPDNGATLDLETCRYSTLVGAGQLAATWTDPDYEPGERAFYYARVLEDPSCRWTTWEAIGRGDAPPASVPAAIRERAWSSPVWVDPASPVGAQRGEAPRRSERD